jgi:hypothetical protein
LPYSPYTPRMDVSPAANLGGALEAIYLGVPSASAIFAEQG